MTTVVCLGNSITNSLLSAAEDYPGVLQTLVDPSWTVTNSGFGGFTTPQLTAGFASYVTPYYAPEPRNRNILIVNEIGNDLVANSASQATALANMQALIALGRANGWRVYFATTMPRSVGFSPAQAAAAQAINAFFLANPSESDGVIDWAADPRLSDPTNATYYADGVHPTAAGAAAIADITFHALVP